VFQGNVTYFNVGTAQVAGAAGFSVQNGSDRNLFVVNASTNNTRDGFDLGKSKSNIFVSNNISSNGVNGIELDGCNDNQIIANGMFFNEHTGVSLDTSTGNLITENDIRENKFYGIHFAMSSTDNLLLVNTVCANTIPDPTDPKNNPPKPAQIQVSKDSRPGTQSIQNIVEDVCP